MCKYASYAFSAAAAACLLACTRIHGEVNEMQFFLLAVEGAAVCVLLPLMMEKWKMNVRRVFIATFEVQRVEEHGATVYWDTGGSFGENEKSTAKHNSSSGC